MDTILNNTVKGRSGPRLIVTTPTIYGLYAIGQASNIRYSNQALADAGFRNLEYSTIPMVLDDYCAASKMYFIDTDNLWLQILAQGNFELTDMQQSINQLIKTALLYLFGNLTTGSRRTNGIATNITG